jgi:hypothetical protein
MIAAEGLAAVGRMIAACRRSDRAATNYEIAWVTVAPRDLEGDGRYLGPDGSRADGCGPMWSGGRSLVWWRRRIPARFGEQSLASGHGATRYLEAIRVRAPYPQKPNAGRAGAS